MFDSQKNLIKRVQKPLELLKRIHTRIRINDSMNSIFKADYLAKSGQHHFGLKLRFEKKFLKFNVAKKTILG